MAKKKVIANDIFRERVVLRGSGDDAELRTVPLDELRLELEAAGSPLPTVTAGPSATVSASREPAQEELDADLEEEPEVMVGDVIAEEPVSPELPEANDPAVAADREPLPGERRPHRRRGRRGGRKNRPGDKETSGSADDAPPKEG